MKGNRGIRLASVIAVLLVCSLGAIGQKTKVKGMISGRDGETLIVNTASGKVNVVLADNTRVKDDRGLFGLEKEELAPTVLIPGLKIEVKGTTDQQGRIVAQTITADGDDIETSQMIQAGLQPTADEVLKHESELQAHQKQIGANADNIATNAAGVDANKQNIAAHKAQIDQNISSIKANADRFATLDDYDVKHEATIKFASGSTKISDEDIEQLKQLAAQALGQNGYIVEVIGYADSQGDAAKNTELSEKRAKAVITTLVQQGNVPMRRIVAPAAMGEYGEAAPNETAEGRAENRRVVIKVLVNKGIAAPSGN